ncbi:unnamed protein product, partial [Iphiclides podalirius]
MEGRNVCETVMIKKEVAERVRERTDPSRRRDHRDEGTALYGLPYINSDPYRKRGLRDRGQLGVYSWKHLTIRADDL